MKFLLLAEKANKKIITGKIKPFPQKGKGTFHKKKDFLEKIDYNTKINEI